MANLQIHERALFLLAPSRDGPPTLSVTPGPRVLLTARPRRRAAGPRRAPTSARCCWAVEDVPRRARGRPSSCARDAAGRDKASATYSRGVESRELRPAVASAPRCRKLPRRASRPQSSSRPRRSSRKHIAPDARRRTRRGKRRSEVVSSNFEQARWRYRRDGVRAGDLRHVGRGAGRAADARRRLTASTRGPRPLRGPGARARPDVRVPAPWRCPLRAADAPSVDAPSADASRCRRPTLLKNGARRAARRAPRAISSGCPLDARRGQAPPSTRVEAEWSLRRAPRRSGVGARRLSVGQSGWVAAARAT